MRGRPMARAVASLRARRRTRIHFCAMVGPIPVPVHHQLLPPRGVEPQPCTKAEEMVSFLELSHPQWDNRIRLGWCFRGQRCDRPLVPSALRKNRRPPTVPEFEALSPATIEYADIFSFVRSADLAGFPIPHDSPTLRRNLYEAAFAGTRDESRWPTDDVLALVALAQHYRVPTRLLDWSYKPLVAAYFAAVKVATAREPEWPHKVKPLDPAKNLVVWACRCLYLTLLPLPDDGIARFVLVDAPKATNPNLAAQAGCFTLDRKATPEQGFEDTFAEAVLAERKRELASGVISIRQRFLGSLEPTFRKFTLPHTEARRLLRLCGLRGVTAASVYPGHQGVADSLYEELCWEP